MDGWCSWDIGTDWLQNPLSLIGKRHLFFVGGTGAGVGLTAGTRHKLPSHKEIDASDQADAKPRPLASEQALSMAASLAMTASIGLQTGAAKAGNNSSKSLLYTLAFAAPTFTSLAMNAFVKSEKEANEHLLGLGALGVVFLGANALGQHGAFSQQAITKLVLASTGVAAGIIIPMSYTIGSDVVDRIQRGVDLKNEIREDGARKAAPAATEPSQPKAAVADAQAAAHRTHIPPH